MVRPSEIARKAQKPGKKSAGTQNAKGQAAIKVGRDSGRVKVFVRVRPMRPQENSRKEQTSVEVSALDAQIHVRDPKYSWEKDYPFDHVFSAGATNHEVCNTLCKPIVTSALNGFNGTLMAYGQTGSGKTYTLMAPDGITTGVVDRCFKRIVQDNKHDYKVSMSYLQIYQEKIYDLLNSTNKVELNIREHPHKGVYVENLSEFVVRSPSEVLNLMAVGRKRLVFAETKMNRTSSRSHSVLTLCIERTLNKGETSKDCVPRAAERRSPLPRKDSKDLPKLTGSPKKTLAAIASAANDVDTEVEEEDEDSLSKMAFTDDVLIRGRIHLCDLAGSERLKKTQAEGDRLSEAQYINSSLLELGNVIHALAEDKKTHVPFRNSTLTRLLQESLGGNCKTSLIVCVSPCLSDVSETKSTLNFGSRAMKITNTAYVNLEVDYQRLSDDLAKLLDSREKDMDNMKESYENRIEKIKSEAETQINTAIAEAQVALSSARSLFDSQEFSLREQLSKTDEELLHEKRLSTDLQGQLSALGRCLYGGVHRAKSALLAELLSMQLFYTIRDLPDEERRKVARKVASEYPFNGTKLIETKKKVMDNTDNILKLFKCYLKLLNKSGQSINDSGLDMRILEEKFANGSLVRVDNFVNGSHNSDVYIECLEDTDSMLLEVNKTDDDKVVESTIDVITPRDDSAEEITTESGSFLGKTKSLRDSLLKIRRSLDDDAVEFLQKAFGVDARDGKGTREDVYRAMKELLQTREHNPDAALSDTLLPSLCAEMALLDQSLCQVLVDKALQSSILLLEHTESRQQCDILSTANIAMNNELQLLRIQVQTLTTENTKLNNKLSETSTFLKDVKTSKSRLENDLSSVFQLYNMRPTDSPTNDESSNTEGLDSGITSLVEENVKLRVELKDVSYAKDELQSQLDITKEELTRVKKVVESLCRGTDSSHETSLREASDTSSRRCSQSKTINCDISPYKHLEEDLGRFLFYVQNELAMIERNETARSEHSQQRDAINNLRGVMSTRMKEEWSLRVLENASLHKDVTNLSKTLETEREDYEKRIEELKRDLLEESQARIDLEHELLQYSKQIAERDDELWNRVNKRPDSGVFLESSVIDVEENYSGSERVEIVQRVVHKNGACLSGDRKFPWTDDVDYGKLLISTQQKNVLAKADSLRGNELDDSLRKKNEELLQVERENNNTKAELESLKRRFLDLGEERADSAKIREELQQRFAQLVEEKNVLESKLEEAEERCEALHNDLGDTYSGQEELEAEVNDLMKHNSTLVTKISDLTESKSALEDELVKTKSQLSSAEVKITLIDCRFKEKCKELEEKVKALKQAEDTFKQSKEEFSYLYQAYEKLQAGLSSDSDRESLVEVRMRSPTHESPKSRRLQSIHLVTRAKGQVRKPGKPLSFKINSPRRAEISYDSRLGSLKRKSLGKHDPKRGSLSRKETKRGSLARVNDSKKNSLRREKDDINGARRTDSQADNRLKNELLLAKEQLVRLKTELTASNVQTTDIGSQLTSLREDSNKLEAELTTMKRTPQSSDSSSSNNGALHLEIDLADSKGKITVLQNQLLKLRQEKTAVEDKMTESEEQMTRLRSQLYKAIDSLDRKEEMVKLLSKENSDLQAEVERLQERLSQYSGGTVEDIVSSSLKDIKDKVNERTDGVVSEHLAYMVNDRKKLQKEIESLSEEKVRLEDMQNLVQQLVSAEDEKIQLKHKLRLALQSSKTSSADDEKHANKDGITITKSDLVHRSQPLDEASDKRFEALHVDNTALRCEVDALRIYIGNLENEIKSLKFKLSVSESTNGNTSKNVLGTLLASAKHEREELRETLNEVYSEKEDMEEELSVSKIKCVKLQRELARITKEKEHLEEDITSLKKGLPVKKSGKDGEESVVNLLQGFLASIGVQNAGEKDIKELVVALIAKNSQQGNEKAKQKPATRQKSRSLDYRQGSLKRNAMKRTFVAKAIKFEDDTNRPKSTVNKSLPNPETTRQVQDRSSQSGLKRQNPNYEREMPEGMENDAAGTNTSKPTVMPDQGTHSRRSKVADVLNGEIHIKRSWTIRGLFKRSRDDNKMSAEPLTINQ